ncbi:MAG: hypothetical protein K9H48_14860 [Melioribacteraceae bacterium]|nr:hypothetical protein [Melioribacteraceae bacterium]MCF8393848.1 hypothetical protein [Melioribacteraceae bacterium]MCF8418221.1 hypothetical protein [Melioribacteraceae bacterium]
MRFKLQKDYIIILLLLISSIGFYSCVNEPTIEHVTRPFTMLRMGNFVINSDLTVQIDDSAPRTLARNTVMSAFEVKSGARNLLVKDVSGNVIYNRSFDALSYDETTLFFGGWASPVDTVTTFGLNSYSDGWTYLNDYTPPKDSGGVFVYNFFADTPTDTAFTIDVTFHEPDSLQDTIKMVNEIDFLERDNVQLAAGNYQMVINEVIDDGSTTTYKLIGIHDITVVEGKRMYISIVGTKSSYDIVTKGINPLPSRPK